MWVDFEIGKTRVTQYKLVPKHEYRGTTARLKNFYLTPEDHQHAMTLALYEKVNVHIKREDGRIMAWICIYEENK